MHPGASAAPIDKALPDGYHEGDKIWIKRHTDTWWRVGKIINAIPITDPGTPELRGAPETDSELAASKERYKFEVEYIYQPVSHLKSNPMPPVCVTYDVYVHDYVRQMFRLDQLKAEIAITMEDNQIGEVAKLTEALKREQDKVCVCVCVCVCVRARARAQYLTPH